VGDLVWSGHDTGPSCRQIAGRHDCVLMVLNRGGKADERRIARVWSG
jgi:hypothetical protein